MCILGAYPTVQFAINPKQAAAIALRKVEFVCTFGTDCVSVESCKPSCIFTPSQDTFQRNLLLVMAPLMTRIVDKDFWSGKLYMYTSVRQEIWNSFLRSDVELAKDMYVPYCIALLIFLRHISKIVLSGPCI